jgi:hypothetical protein
VTSAVAITFWAVIDRPQLERAPTCDSSRNRTHATKKAHRSSQDYTSEGGAPRPAAGGLDRRLASDESFFTKITDLTRKTPFYGQSGSKDALSQCNA